MKYEKAMADVIVFDGMDVFTYTSSEEKAINDGIKSLGCTGFSGVASDGSFTCTKFGGYSGQTIPGTYGFVLYVAYDNWQVNGV